MKSNHTRYQVLYKAHAPRTGVEYVNCATVTEARRVAAKLRRQGEREVQIWDTLHNPISDLFQI